MEDKEPTHTRRLTSLASKEPPGTGRGTSFDPKEVPRAVKVTSFDPKKVPRTVKVTSFDPKKVPRTVKVNFLEANEPTCTASGASAEVKLRFLAEKLIKKWSITSFFPTMMVFFVNGIPDIVFFR